MYFAFDIVSGVESFWWILVQSLGGGPLDVSFRRQTKKTQYSMLLYAIYILSDNEILDKCQGYCQGFFVQK